jgi:FkbM family methyltransferase
MISYAQNFEDVILHRVFRNKKDGFYIDVGAWDPVVDSVTKFFYDEGWCGINIEPNECYFNKLAAERERDINLHLALGQQEEIRTFYVFKEYGNSTFDEPSRDRFVELGFQAEPKSVKVSTLAAICRDHVDRPIDFLKVDCEGWEKKALGGADWDRFRPIVIVVEATLPQTNIPSYLEWEPILMEAQYDMVYFDGLNRFYLRRDSPGLRAHFGSPPNVFDEFKVYATEAAEQTAQVMQRERDDLAGRVAELESRLNSAAEDNQRLAEFWRAAEAEVVQAAGLASAVAEQTRQALERQHDLAAGRLAALEAQGALAGNRIAELEKERGELGRALLKARLWVGQLSQDLAAGKR